MNPKNTNTEIISWNVNGLRACRKKTFDSFIAARDPDILCLQEVKLNPEVIPEEDFGYPYRHYHLAEKKATQELLFFLRRNRFRFRRIYLIKNIMVRDA